MSLPRRNLKDELLYFCHKHPTITDTCKTTLVLLSTPICCCICCCCWVGYCGRGDGCKKGAYKKEKQARMDIVHWQRKVHALKRRQSLSIGATASFSTKLRREKVSIQAACPLFTKIPAEIREIIFRYALTKTGAVRWILNRDWAHRFTVPRSYSCMPTAGNPAEIQYACHFTGREASGCALLRTCRLIYTEAISILYSNTQFRFDNSKSLHAFSAITPTSRLGTIRSLRINSVAGLGERDFLAVIRLKCWENLRVVYIASDWPILKEYSPFETIVAEAEGLKHCVFYYMLYQNESHVKDPNIAEDGGPKLLSYKYADPKADPNWRDAEWCTVGEL